MESSKFWMSSKGEVWLPSPTTTVKPPVGVAPQKSNPRLSGLQAVFAVLVPNHGTSSKKPSPRVSDTTMTSTSHLPFAKSSSRYSRTWQTTNFCPNVCTGKTQKDSYSGIISSALSTEHVENAHLALENSSLNYPLLSHGALHDNQHYNLFFASRIRCTSSGDKNYD
ncbi:unnamed protein product [Nesidiocoris tenuis]|uniref:Uncharacterized protein n=1 Tax=Nesidiocoris tenuis TaxID=355587 RepID=A0A6H5HAL1_9HEMI|nr:unnamed protein product [Nesidiocoris tenuis]